MTPQPLGVGLRGGMAEGKHEGGTAVKGKGGGIMLRRGLVITEAVRAELLNPLSHRFKLLRRAP